MIIAAIAFENIKSLEYFTKDLECHLRVSLRSPPILNFSKMQESSPVQAESFSMLLAIDKQSNELIKFIWNDLRLLWDSFHLEYIIEEMSNVKYLEGIKLLLKSNTSHEIYMGMRA